jgi:signal transduction histidine kinase
MNAVEATADRRTPVKQRLLSLGVLSHDVSSTDTSTAWMRGRFIARARALFYARMVFLTLGLLILAVPVWRSYFAFSPLAFGGYFFMLLYSVANYLVLTHARLGPPITYVTLLFDLVMMVIVVAKPLTGGGLANPLLASQLLFTTLFALLFPRPLAILPPLLALPIVTRIDQLLNRTPTAIEILTLLWYLALNIIIIYVLVYLNEREVTAHREIVELEQDLRDLAVVEERNRLAREIHDGLGASLSSLIIQAEYLGSLAKDEPLKHEIAELKTSAEESIEELRRSLRMMREDFDLAAGLEDYVKTFGDRTQLPVRFERSGEYLGKLAPESSLALFRVLQELLTNALKHAQASQVDVRMTFLPERVQLSVKDNGRGFDPNVAQPGHYGLLNLRERANKIGATVEVDSKPGLGVHVTLSVPMPIS